MHDYNFSSILILLLYIFQCIKHFNVQKGTDRRIKLLWMTSDWVWPILSLAMMLHNNPAWKTNHIPSHLADRMKWPLMNNGESEWKCLLTRTVLGCSRQWQKEKNSFNNTAKNTERTMEHTLNMTFINICTRWNKTE